MPDSHKNQRCIFCKIGNVAKGDQKISFKQSTDKGYIVCDVTIPMDTCDHCGMKTWDYNAEAIVRNPTDCGQDSDASRTAFR